MGIGCEVSGYACQCIVVHAKGVGISFGYPPLFREGGCLHRFNRFGILEGTYLLCCAGRMPINHHARISQIIDTARLTVLSVL